jgi:hypothetical protein
MIHADMQFLKITPLRTFPITALMRPERIVIREHFAQRYPPHGKDSGTANHSRSEEKRRRGESFSDSEAACIALQVGLQCNATGGAIRENRTRLIVQVCPSARQ